MKRLATMFTTAALWAVPAVAAEKAVIQTTAGPKAIGPYSQGVRAGNFVFVSGQLPFDPTGTLDYTKLDVSAQTGRCLDDLKAILEAANLTLDNVVSVTVYVTDLNDFEAVNKVYSSYFRAPYPARAFVQVAKLLRDAKVEISATAAVP